MWTIFKVFKSVTLLLLFYVWGFGPKGYGIWAPHPGTESHDPYTGSLNHWTSREATKGKL